MFHIFSDYYCLISASNASQLCSAPTLMNGYFVPEQTRFHPEDQLTYACNKGYKPAVDGWWVTVTCQNGTWSHVPQCISKCLMNVCAGCWYFETFKYMAVMKCFVWC